MNIMLALLVVMVFVVPALFTSNTFADRIIQDLLLAGVLLSGVVNASDRSKAFALVLVVALLAIALRVAGWFSPDSLSSAIRNEAALLSLALLGAVVGREVFGAGHVDRDRVCGAIVIYILAGAVCADAYQLIDFYVPGAFAGAFSGAFSGVGPQQAQAGHSSWVYFSFVSLTSVGYGDIVPVAPVARSLANLEALLGQLYPAIVLARLVSLQLASGNAGKRS
ncbi:potassium channel family protein [Paraburkholderia sp. BCC1886]|uniref:potassium channel family protein n=1 Tax=Paraburkholderia sp. BCC1886 TaxID=2562670 RepID=UPI0021B422CA|nr:potassium channel family protein [Paraburkholderia sp. BCC1886]